MDHCILWPLCSLFSPCQWSLLPRCTVSIILGRRRRGEKSDGNAFVCVHACAKDRQGAKEHNTKQELPRARSLAGGPRLSSASICRYSLRECAIIALRTHCWQAFQAHVGLRLSSWQFTVFACDSSSRRAHASQEISRANPSVFLSHRSFNSRVSWSLLTFCVFIRLYSHVPSTHFRCVCSISIRSRREKFLDGLLDAYLPHLSLVQSVLDYRTLVVTLSYPCQWRE